MDGNNLTQPLTKKEPTMADTKSMGPNQIVFVAPTFLSEDGSSVDVTGFPITVASADETKAVWGRFTPAGQPDEAGAYGVKSLLVLGSTDVTYAVTNPDGSLATLTGTITVENEEAATGSMNFSEPIDVPAAA
jgi:hypothetical protein